RVVGHPAARGRGLRRLGLLGLQLGDARIPGVVLLAAFLDPLAGVVRDPADHGRPHQRATSSHHHLRTVLSLVRLAEIVRAAAAGGIVRVWGTRPGAAGYG